MKRFEYIRATAPEQAAIAASSKEASFIAGGTNLLDLMKLEIETPIKLVDVTRLELEQIETTANGGLRIGTLVTNSDLAANPEVIANYPVLSRAIWRARLGNCVIKPQLAATFYSVRVVIIFIKPIARAINANPVPAVPLSMARTAPLPS